MVAPGTEQLLGRAQKRPVLLMMHSRGFTLVELMIGLVILAILMLLALPTFTSFMGNSRIRNTADSMMNGVRLAQVEAIKRNRIVEFQVDPALGWVVRDPAPPPFGGDIHQEVFSDSNATITINPLPAGSVMLTFSGIGQFLLTNPSDGSVPINRIEVQSATIPNPNNLEVITNPALGAGMRVCDRDFTDLNDPKTGSIACP